MRKNKKMLYLMFPLIVLVWGFVFYQLFSYFFSAPKYGNPITQHVMNIDEIQRDTFSIVADYRDPFLGTTRSTNKIITGNKKSITNITKATNKVWPSIDYKGMIKNNNSNKRVGIVKIDGKEYLVKQGEVLNEVTVVKIDKAFIKVRFQRENKTINK